MNHPENPHIQKAIQDYPNLYSRMIADWSQPGTDKVWLMYSANYLFRVGETRFTIDPMTLSARLGTTLPATISDDLIPLQLVALTHDHSDHVSWPLLSSIAASVQKWIVPAWMQSQFNQNIPSPVGSIQFVQPGDSIKFGEICIKVFDGNHWETQANPKDGKPFMKGLPSLAYLIEGHGKRWLLPGDTRSFKPENRISCGKVDLTLAHVFLRPLETSR